jgi:hypothetical protein
MTVRKTSGSVKGAPVRSVKRALGDFAKKEPKFNRELILKVAAEWPAGQVAELIALLSVGLANKAA